MNQQASSADQNVKVKNNRKLSNEQQNKLNSNDGNFKIIKNFLNNFKF